MSAHIDHLLRQADAYAAGDWARSDRLYREGYAHAVGLGRTLAATLLPPAAARTLQQPTWRLRSELGRLLGEHVVLVVAAMRAGVTDSPDFSTAARSVDGNTRDLAGAVDVLFGPAAARQFQGLWADHVDLMVAYSAAGATGDRARRAAVGRRLGGFELGLSRFLAAATGNKVTATALARALRSHDGMLQRQVDAFVGKRYVDAQDARVLDLPGDVRAGEAAVRRLRRHRGRPAAAGCRPDRAGRDGRRRGRAPMTPARVVAALLLVLAAAGLRAAHRARCRWTVHTGRRRGGAARRPPPTRSGPAGRTTPSPRRCGCGSPPSAWTPGWRASGGRPTGPSRCRARPGWPAGTRRGRGRGSPDRP